VHYDGTPITARFIAKAIGDHLDQLKVTPLRKVFHDPGSFHDIRSSSRNSIIPICRRTISAYTHRDYEGKVSTAVRRLRPRFDHQRHHRGVLQALHRAAQGGQKFPASAARRRRRIISSAIRTALIRCTAACRRC